MIEEFVSIEHVIGVLNRALAEDPEAMRTLTVTRIACNDTLASDPTIQVSPQHEVGMLGIINGIFGVSHGGWGTIAAQFNLVCCDGHDAPDGAKLDDRCERCGSSLQLGRLQRFVDLGYR